MTNTPAHRSAGTPTDAAPAPAPAPGTDGSRPRLRALVTGSRGWSDGDAVQHALVAAASGLAHQDVTVVHGHCPTGADRLADWCARALGMQVERHPADFSQGRQAGPERNQKMVDLGADVCLAFIGACTSPRCTRTDSHPSHGASGCADMAEDAGIRVLRFYATDLPTN